MKNEILEDMTENPYKNSVSGKSKSKDGTTYACATTVTRFTNSNGQIMKEKSCFTADEG